MSENVYGFNESKSKVEVLPKQSIVAFLIHISEFTKTDMSGLGYTNYNHRVYLPEGFDYDNVIPVHYFSPEYLGDVKTKVQIINMAGTWGVQISIEDYDDILSGTLGLADQKFKLMLINANATSNMLASLMQV